MGGQIINTTQVFCYKYIQCWGELCVVHSPQFLVVAFVQVQCMIIRLFWYPFCTGTALAIVVECSTVVMSDIKASLWHSCHLFGWRKADTEWDKGKTIHS